MTDQKPDGQPSVTTFRGFDLYPFQTEAIGAIERRHSVIVAAPTGAGKTLVADYAIEACLNAGERIVYTSPIKALSNQKFRDFRERHGDAVGIMTGDVTINGDAPLLIMTTEVFRNTIFENPGRLKGTRYVVFDEVHYIDDQDRGTVWEESIIFAPDHIRFVCLSATVPNVKELASWIRRTRGGRIDVVVHLERPVPLRHFLHTPGAGMIKLADAKRKFANLRKRRQRKRDPVGKEVLDMLEDRHLLPCLYFCFSRKDCEKLARAHARRNLLSTTEREKILATFEDLVKRYQLADDDRTGRLRNMAMRGSMYHHAGLLPIHKEIVERLFATGLVKLLFTTETFALGVNMPARTVVFHQLKKFDGVAMNWLRTRDYYQMAGRAGRQGIDDVGHVVSRIELKWDNPHDAQRLIEDKVEAVRSRFNLSYSGLLSLYERLGEENLAVAYERSFAKFQRERRRNRKGKGKKRPPREAMSIQRRLEVLTRTGYIDEDGLTQKGRFAEYLNGYEVQAAEMFGYGVFHLASEIQLAILMVALVFEERKGDASKHLDPGVLREIKRLSESKIREFRRVEFDCGLRELVKEPDFRMAGPTHLWARGGSLQEVRETTTISDGDLVRNFRMAIQLMRQVRSQLGDEHELKARFQSAIEMMDRDEVDARKQLELG
ncbi:MAG: DEAD/DEAH box helicase [Planctomycetota bacterium]